MPIQTADAPLIVTARLDDRSFLHLDGLRRRHFPPERNVVPAHVSLFHNLPGRHVGDIVRTIEEICGRRHAFEMRPSRVIFLGRGVAFRYDGGELGRLHADLANRWMTWLTPQDRQKFTPHVTIQNKADPVAARSLFESLTVDDVPSCRVEGLSIWHYLGGPWATCAQALFAGPPQ